MGGCSAGGPRLLARATRCSGTAREHAGSAQGRAGEPRQGRPARKACTAATVREVSWPDTSRTGARSRTGTTDRPAYGVPLATLAAAPGEPASRDPGRPLAGTAHARPAAAPTAGAVPAAHRTATSPTGTTHARRPLELDHTQEAAASDDGRRTHLRARAQTASPRGQTTPDNPRPHRTDRGNGLAASFAGQRALSGRARTRHRSLPSFRATSRLRAVACRSVGRSGASRRASTNVG